MPETYSLTVINNSELQRPTFAVFATLPVDSAYETLPLAWFTRQIDAGNEYTFTWDITWGFMWAGQGAEKGYQWQGTGRRPANPDSEDLCSVAFGYDGDFYFASQVREPDGAHLRIDDAASIPLPSEQACSVGVTLDGKPACVTNAGKNLHQTFTLHPTYYLDAGNYVQGQMVDGDSTTDYLELEYSGTNRGLTATLNADNTWTLEKSANVNFAHRFSQLVAAKS